MVQNPSMGSHFAYMPIAPLMTSKIMEIFLRGIPNGNPVGLRIPDLSLADLKRDSSYCLIIKPAR
jgi:hypothetical protein